MNLFKYKTGNTTIFAERDFPFIEDDLIWFSKIESLNDPYEGTYLLNKAHKVGYDLIFPNRKNAFINLLNARMSLATTLNKTLGILSLSPEKDNLLMWSHYADNHKGYLLEYNFDENSFHAIGDHKSFTNNMKKEKVKYSRNPLIHSIFDDNKYLQVTNKSISWSYENEIRFITSHYGKYRYDGKSLKSIYLGANSNEELKIALAKFCIVRDLPLYKAEIPKGKFELIFNRII